MGLLDDLKKGLDIAGGTITGVAPGERLTSAIPSGSAIAGIFGGTSTLGFGGGFDQPGEEAKDEDGLAAMLDMSFATRAQEVNDQLSKARTPEEFLAANQASLELFALLNQRESLLASGTALTELQQIFDESDDSEIAVGQLDALLSEVNTLLTPEGQIADSLSDEDQQFQDLLRRGTELDVLLKEQQLAEAQRQQEFAGVFNLLDVLPAKQRADVVAALLETPLGQNLFFGGQGSFSGAPNQGGTPLPSGAQSPGEVFEQAFRGGQ
jgi:hypothetical protein